MSKSWDKVSKGTLTRILERGGWLGKDSLPESFERVELERIYKELTGIDAKNLKFDRIKGEKGRNVTVLVEPVKADKVWTSEKSYNREFQPPSLRGDHLRRNDDGSAYQVEEERSPIETPVDSPAVTPATSPKSKDDKTGGAFPKEESLNKTKFKQLVNKMILEQTRKKLKVEPKPLHTIFDDDAFEQMFKEYAKDMQIRHQSQKEAMKNVMQKLEKRIEANKEFQKLKNEKERERNHEEQKARQQEQQNEQKQKQDFENAKDVVRKEHNAHIQQRYVEEGKDKILQKKFDKLHALGSAIGKKAQEKDKQKQNEKDEKKRFNQQRDAWEKYNDRAEQEAHERKPEVQKQRKEMSARIQKATLVEWPADYVPDPPKSEFKEINRNNVAKHEKANIDTSKLFVDPSAPSKVDKALTKNDKAEEEAIKRQPRRIVFHHDREALLKKLKSWI